MFVIEPMSMAPFFFLNSFYLFLLVFLTKEKDKKKMNKTKFLRQPPIDNAFVWKQSPKLVLSTWIGLKKFQAMFLIQIPTPKFLVVLIVRVAPVNGRWLLSEFLGRADQSRVARAEEWRNRHSLFVWIHNCTVPNTSISSIT